MRRADQLIRAEQTHAAFMLACARLLQANGFLAMDRSGTTWAHGLHVYPTVGDALLAADEPALAQAWRHLTGATS